jgi:hypothetical protein
MGLIGKAIGGPAAISALGEAAKSVAEVFNPSATRRMELSAEAQMAALREMGAEFDAPALGMFDRFVNGLNRLPRPFLAFGTIGLFVYAMTSPVEFAQRMVGLNAVPEPLWWLLGAVVAFYFGARETYYFRNRPLPTSGLLPATAAVQPDENPALSEWRAGDR